MEPKSSRATHTFETSNGIEITLSHFLDSTWALSNARKVNDSGRWVSALDDPHTLVAAVAKTHAIGGKTLMKLNSITGETTQIKRIDVVSEMQKNQQSDAVKLPIGAQFPIARDYSLDKFLAELAEADGRAALAAAESKHKVGDSFSSQGMDFHVISEDAFVLLSPDTDRTLALKAAHADGAKQLMISSNGVIVIDVEKALLARAQLSVVRDASTIATYHRAYGLRQLDQSVFADIVVTSDFMREFRSKLGDGLGTLDITAQLLDLHRREHAVATKATQSLFERLKAKVGLAVEPTMPVGPIASNFLVDGVRRFMADRAEKKAEAAVKQLKESVEQYQQLVDINTPASTQFALQLGISSQLDEINTVMRSIKNPLPHLNDQVKEVVTQARGITDVIERIADKLAIGQKITDGDVTIERTHNKIYSLTTTKPLTDNLKLHAVYLAQSVGATELMYVENANARCIIVQEGITARTALMSACKNNDPAAAGKALANYVSTMQLRTFENDALLSFPEEFYTADATAIIKREFALQTTNPALIDTLGNALHADNSPMSGKRQVFYPPLVEQASADIKAEQREVKSAEPQIQLWPLNMPPLPGSLFRSAQSSPPIQKQYELGAEVSHTSPTGVKVVLLKYGADEAWAIKTPKVLTEPELTEALRFADQLGAKFLVAFQVGLEPSQKPSKPQRINVAEALDQPIIIARIVDKFANGEKINAAIEKGRELQKKYDFSLLPTSMLGRATQLFTSDDSKKHDADTEVMR